MLLNTGFAFLPLIILGAIGFTAMVFPVFTLNIKHYNGSMKGTIVNNDMQFRPSAIWITRIAGGVMILIGLYLFLLIGFDVDLLQRI